MAGEAAKDRGRRTQAERTAETRGRIVAAVVESIAEIGFQRTTASEIAQRSGVTWGAVQHHFGGKDGILAAVLEDSFARFERRLADVPPARSGTPLEERVSRFVDGAWQHFESAPYRSTFEILLNHARPGARGGRRLVARRHVPRLEPRVGRGLRRRAPFPATEPGPAALHHLGAVRTRRVEGDGGSGRAHRARPSSAT